MNGKILKRLFSCMIVFIMIFTSELSTMGAFAKMPADNTQKGEVYDAIFNAKYYADKYADLKAAYGYDYNLLLNHFLASGMDEGRQGNDEFNVYSYMEMYPDLKNAFGSNLRQYYFHYMNYGKNEGRIGNGISNASHNTAEKTAEKTNIKSDMVSVNNTVTISIAGDCTLGEYLGQSGGGQFKDYYKMYGPAYFLENVKSVFESDDITFVNLEGPLTSYKQTVKKTYPIKGNSENVKCLTTSSVEVVNLSNNHIYDCGQNGYLETKTILDSNGIGYCGEGNVYTTTVNGITVSFFGYMGMSDNATLRNKIQADLMACQSDIKIVMFHWGIERDYVHNATQANLAHFTIDNGADLVVGAHPHVLQDVETYKGKLICYSLGNFSFGANKNPSDKDTCILRVEFSKNGMIEANAIPCKISSVNNCNDYKPTIVTDEAVKNTILHKMGLK